MRAKRDGVLATWHICSGKATVRAIERAFTGCRWMCNQGKIWRCKYISMFALFGRSVSSREKFIECFRFNTGLELPMKPVEQMPPMATLDFTARLPNGDRALPLGLQAIAFFFEEDIGQHRQRPEANESRGAHQLILVQAQFFLAISKEDFDVPTRGNMREQHHWRRLQIDFSPNSVPATQEHPTTAAQSQLGTSRACAPVW